MATAKGLVAVVVTILSLRCGGLLHLATVCTSFNFMNSGTHTRSISFPLGWRGHLAYIDLGNVLGARSAVLALLAWAMGGFPILEQPQRSVMTALPSWQSVLGYFREAELKGWAGQGLKLSKINMASFRAPTLKPTDLYSTEAFDLLINTRVPPKSERPPTKGPVCYEHLGLTCFRFCLLGKVTWQVLINPKKSCRKKKFEVFFLFSKCRPGIATLLVRKRWWEGQG